ncbi:exonuclease domain-containing protein [Helicobacter kayseriensis]|uniref:exonuclease domain-containing protein n=1 Tax=Helicobacter kayseriensis TaxID=2905877 RepID=UPI001E5C4815|nr:exonuclease domain-containing protein [Helicobacter kayseriensis]MCE3046914.1 DNA polymerase III subunit epsilon [Helicobacter kayseriensis]MCE3048426.1 DNA polymerase III subunit epsilon [Helicobacter kayseriensis]
MHIIIQDPSLKPKYKKQKKIKSPSQSFLDQIANKTLEIPDFLQLCHQDEKLRDFHLDHLSLDFLRTIGMDLAIQDQKVFLHPKITHIQDQLFCFVDLETTDGNPLKGNLLEIGAILCNGKGEILGRFEHLVKNTTIPPIVTQITGISLDDVANALEVQEVLQQFRAFIGTSIFVAHNVNFDYIFLDSLYLKHFGIGLYNQTLCTLKMAQKCIQAPRYSLDFLNQFLEIQTPISHRAYADALTCKEVFLRCLNKLPSKNTQNVLNWLKHK